MLSKLQRHLSKVFLKIFLRDRQSIFFSLFFPIIFMSVFGFLNNGDSEPVSLGLVNNSNSGVAADFVNLLMEDPLFTVTAGAEADLRQQLIAGDQMAVLVLPADFNEPGAAPRAGTQLRLLTDAAQFRQLGLIQPVLEQKLIAIERQFRGVETMFSLAIEDVQARSQRYLDFLLPGLLAFTLMQLSIAGSGFNVVEFRRKGILKRLFVTPIQPRDFVTAIVVARLGIVLLQLSLLLAYALFVLNVNIVGNFVEFYLVVIFASLVFLNLGFCVGSIAKTQQAVMAIGNIVIFPQIFLSGVFYPIEAMPALVQPIAQLLPLSFVVSGLRDIAVDGAALAGIVPSLLGMAIWFVLGFVLATRMFVWKDVAI